MQVTAKAKYLRSSARKLRLVADLVRDMRVVDAQELLVHTHKKAAVLVGNAVASAAANAEHNHNISKNKLVISEIRVDEGPSLKRFRPRARGSASRVLKRTSHLTVIVKEPTNKTVDSKSAATPSKSTESKKGAK